MVGFASEHNQAAWEPASPRCYFSRFTEALMRRIEESGSRLDFGILLQSVRRDVAEATEGLQQPCFLAANDRELLLLRNIGSVPLLVDSDLVGRQGARGPRFTVGDIVRPLLAAAKAHVRVSSCQSSLPGSMM